MYDSSIERPVIPLIRVTILDPGVFYAGDPKFCSTSLTQTAAIELTRGWDARYPGCESNDGQRARIHLGLVLWAGHIGPIREQMAKCNDKTLVIPSEFFGPAAPRYPGANEEVIAFGQRLEWLHRCPELHTCPTKGDCETRRKCDPAAPSNVVFPHWMYKQEFDSLPGHIQILLGRIPADYAFPPPLLERRAAA